VLGHSTGGAELVELARPAAEGSRRILFRAPRAQRWRRPGREAEEQKIQLLRNLPENVFAVREFIRTNKIDGWVKERLTGLNTNVRFVHNKFLLVDPSTSGRPVLGVLQNRTTLRDTLSKATAR
jgi:hypothetical protein